MPPKATQQSQADIFRALPVRERERRIASLTSEEADALLFDWEFWCRPNQVMPIDPWIVWLVLAGRGFGKTRVGAETVRVWVQNYPIVNLVGSTADDARDIMVEGESGILASCPNGERPVYLPSKRKLQWPNGAVSLIFTADEPERLRGKQHFKLWCLTGDSQVLMADGSCKQLRDVQVGDYVQSRDGAHRVTASALTKHDTEIISLLTSDGRSVLGTTDHPVWVDGRGFTALEFIEPGMLVCAIDALNGMVTSGTLEQAVTTAASSNFTHDHAACVTLLPVVSVRRLEQRADVYNITIEGSHEFFANGILVHNCDELASWRYEDSWDQAQFGLRLGNNPQCVVTTTPKPTKLIRELVKDKNTVITRGSTMDNRENLAAAFYTKIITKYQGTRLGRQELNAELLEDNPGALWTRKIIEETRVTRMPELKRIVVAIDPAMTAHEDSDLTGIVVAGVDAQFPPHYYVIDDLSLIGTPEEWTKTAVKAYHDQHADRVVAEVNNGGDMVEAVLRTKDLELAYRAVHASRGKVTRAEPISALYEQKRVHHVGVFGALEDEMTDYNPMTSTKSPDRMDALVWAITELSGAAAAGTIFRNFWTPDLLYTEATRPTTLSHAGGFAARYVVVTYGTSNTTCFLDVIDDGTTLWFDREYVWDTTREAKQRTNAMQGEELQKFIGEQTRSTQVLLTPSALSLQSEMMKRGIFNEEMAAKEEDVVEGIRLASSMMSRQTIRVNQACCHLLSQIGSYSWDQRKSANGDEVPMKGSDFAVVPAVLCIKNKIPMWRIAS